MGDPSKLVLLDALVREAGRDGGALFASVRAAGAYLLAGLEDIAARRPGLVADARGAGLFCALTVRGGRRDALVGALRARGVECGGSGDHALRFRPALIFQPRHAAVVLEILDATLAEMDV